MEDYVDRELDSSDNSNNNPNTANGDVSTVERGVDQDADRSRCGDACARCCSSFCSCSISLLGFLTRHVSLMAIVVGYCFLGGFVFEKLEKEHEWSVKDSVGRMRDQVADDIWALTEESGYLKEDEWTQKVDDRMKQFEKDLINAMKKQGWNGVEDYSNTQWTFPGSLFYSIICITTIGYGNQTPKTPAGKLLTIAYAIVGMPLMLLCLTNTGNAMAQSFRFVYWRVFCACMISAPRVVQQQQPTPRRRLARGRSIRSLPPKRTFSIRSTTSSAMVSRRPSPPLKRLQRRSRIHQSPTATLIHASATWNAMVATGSLTTLHGRDDVPLHHHLHHQSGPNSPDGVAPISPLWPGQVASTPPARARLPPLIMPPTPATPAQTPATSPSPLVRNCSFDDLQQHQQQQQQQQSPPVHNSIIRAKRSGSNRSQKSLGLPLPSASSGKRDQSDSSPSSPGNRSFLQRRRQRSRYNRPRSMLAGSIRSAKTFDYDEDYLEEEDLSKKEIPLTVCCFLVVGYVIGGAVLFHEWEGWRPLDSAYFCFITLTTIGFGDFVPKADQRVNKEVGIALCSLYLLFGMSLLVMTFNLVQQRVVDKVRRVAMMMGIIKGDDVFEFE